MRRAHIDPDVHGTEGVAEDAPEERLLLALARRGAVARYFPWSRAPGVRASARTASAGRRRWASSGSVVQRSYCFERNIGSAWTPVAARPSARMARTVRAHRVPCGLRRHGLATSDTSTSTSSLTPTPRYWGFAIPIVGDCHGEAGLHPDGPPSWRISAWPAIGLLRPVQQEGAGEGRLALEGPAGRRRPAGRRTGPPSRSPRPLPTSR